MKEQMKQEIKKGMTVEEALEHIGERKEVCVDLFSLRDEKIVKILSKKLEVFEPAMLGLDLKNWSNREFVNDVLDKYQKKFDWSSDEDCDALFSLALELENKKTIKHLIQKKQAKERYSQLASATKELFELIAKVKAEDLENDDIVEFIVQAALSEDARERLASLKARGFVPTAKNTDGKTASQVLSERLENAKYDKNKSGSVRKQQDKNALQYLERWEKGQIPEVKKPFPWHIVWPSVLAVVVVVSVSIGVGVELAEKKEAEELRKQSEQAMQEAEAVVDYNTDPSLVVADGDTVNIDYVGTVDGVEFEGGSTGGAGTQLVIGSGSYIDDFEEQLVGHNVGETVEVNVTFPDEYGNEELNGKDAVFEVVINGIYENE